MLTQIPKALLKAHLNIMLEKTAILKQMSAAPFCKHYVTFCTEGKKKMPVSQKVPHPAWIKGNTLSDCKLQACALRLPSQPSISQSKSTELWNKERWRGGGKVPFLEEKTGNNQSLFTAMFVQFKLASKPGSAEERWIWLRLKKTALISFFLPEFRRFWCSDCRHYRRTHICMKIREAQQLLKKQLCLHLLELKLRCWSSLPSSSPPPPLPAVCCAHSIKHSQKLSNLISYRWTLTPVNSLPWSKSQLLNSSFRVQTSNNHLKWTLKTRSVFHPRYDQESNIKYYTMMRLLLCSVMSTTKDRWRKQDHVNNSLLLPVEGCLRINMWLIKDSFTLIKCCYCCRSLAASSMATCH